MKRIKPYVVLIVVSGAIFIITQTIDTRIWHLGSDSYSTESTHSDRTAFQMIVFVLGVSIILAWLSFSKPVKGNFPQFKHRMLLSLGTITCIYGMNYFLSKVFVSDGFNIYKEYRQNLGIPSAIYTSIIMIAFMGVLLLLRKAKV
jgi:hypothetical protein